MDSCGRTWALQLSKFLGHYQWLLDSYVIEFFTEQHWGKLPPSWREILSRVELSEISQLLLNGPIRGRVYPLSFLAFVITAHTLSLPRGQRTIIKSRPNNGLPAGLENEALQSSRPVRDQTFLHGGNKRLAEEGRVSPGAENPSQISGLDHTFRRHVKPKKQLEIKLLGEVIFKLAQTTKCQNIIDIGAGQGHLARYLAFHYGLVVTAVEAVGCHLKTAAKFDSEVRKELEKKDRHRAERTDHVGPAGEERGSLRHIETLIHPETTASELLEQLGLWNDPGISSVDSTQSATENLNGRLCHPREQQRYILVGLHTCGDLAPTTLRMYCQSRQIAGLVSVGCCYMKITCTPDGGSEPDDVDKTPVLEPDQTPVLEPDQTPVLEPDQTPVLEPDQTPVLEPDQTPVLQPDRTPVLEPDQTPVLEPGQTAVVLEPGSQSCPSTTCEATLSTEVVDGSTGIEDKIGERSADISASCSPLPSGACPTTRVRTQGYPLSEYVRSLPGHTLSFEAREVACHSIESYHQRLQEESEYLKVHCHRAVIETILRKNGLRRSQVRVGKRVSKLPFEDYAKAVFQSVNLPTDFSKPGLQALAPLLAQWKKVAVFFILRQLVAPCVESLLLLDRVLFLREKGHCVDLMPAFDPKISPRNFVIVAHTCTMS